MRAALLGARLCNHMAEVLPIETDQLTRAAKVHENYAIALLDGAPPAMPPLSLLRLLSAAA